MNNQAQSNAQINVLDTVSYVFEADIMTGVVWMIETNSITFRTGNSLYSVPRALAEIDTVLLEKYNREAVIAFIIGKVA